MPRAVSAPDYSAESPQRLQEGEIRELPKKDYGAAATQYLVRFLWRAALRKQLMPSCTWQERWHVPAIREANRVCQALLHDSTGARDAGF